jgi:hypothetical protein
VAIIGKNRDKFKLVLFFINGGMGVLVFLELDRVNFPVAFDIMQVQTIIHRIQNERLAINIDLLKVVGQLTFKSAR